LPDLRSETPDDFRRRLPIRARRPGSMPGDRLVAMTDRPSYRYQVLREDRWWIVRVPDLGLVTQARRLPDVERLVRSIIALHTGTEPDDFDVVRAEAVGLPTSVADLVRRATDARSGLERAVVDTARITEHAARVLVDEGITLRDAGSLLGLSHQRVAQLVGGAARGRAKLRAG
jgi:hypothetical protein